MLQDVHNQFLVTDRQGRIPGPQNNAFGQVEQYLSGKKPSIDSLFPFISVVDGRMRNDPTSNYFVTGFEIWDTLIDMNRNIPRATDFTTVQHTNGTATVTLTAGTITPYSAQKWTPVPWLELRIGESQQNDIVGSAVTIKITGSGRNKSVGGSNPNNSYSSTNNFSFTVIPTKPGCVARVFGWIYVDGKIKFKPFGASSSTADDIVIKISNNYGPTTIVAPGVDDPYLNALKTSLLASMK